jgi:ribose transport system substrate-binding protein
MQCPVSVCALIGDALERGAKQLGWSVRRVQETSFAPDATLAAWHTVLQNPGDAVWEQDGSAAETVQPLVNQLAAKGIPYVGGAYMVPVQHAIAITAGKPSFVQRGQLMADWVAVDSKGKANVVFFNDNSMPNQLIETQSFETEFQTACPGCSFSRQIVSAADIGTKIPAQVVAYVQANPKTNYISLGFGQLATGLAAALRGAGIQPSQMKIVSGAGTSENFVAIAAGNNYEVMNLSEDLAISALRALDALARAFEGENPDDIAKIVDGPYPSQFITKQTVQNPTQPYQALPSDQEFGAYFNLWHVA